jgi:phenylpyruvate tautomerase
MPTLQVSTNTNIVDHKQFARAASKLVADMLGKPEMYVMIIVKPKCELYFGGNDDPAALLSLHSLGLPEAQIKAYSERLCSFISQQLGISAERIYINFESPPRTHWGWNNTTFG